MSCVTNLSLHHSAMPTFLKLLFGNNLDIDDSHIMTFYKLCLLLALVQHALPQNLATGPLSPPYTCTTTLCSAGTIHPNSATSIPQGRPGKTGAPGIIGPKGEKGDPCVCQIEVEGDLTELREGLKEEKLKREQLEKKLDLLQKIFKYPATCDEFYERQAILGHDAPNNTLVKLYPLKSRGFLKPVMTNCSTGWITFQRRQDGSVDFYRNWTSYVDGFGSTSGEFWLGLQMLHLLTTLKPHKLRVDLEDWEGVKRYAEYSTFSIGNEDTNYALTIGGYSGDAGDSLEYHNGQSFSTYDRGRSSCAKQYSGAWWYNTCYNSNLNGKYFKTSASTGYKGIAWKIFHPPTYSLKKVEMKIQAID